MKRLLLPLEETDRSLKALQYVTDNFSPDEAEVVAVMVDETIEYSIRQDKEPALKDLDDKLELIRQSLDGYKVITRSTAGKAGVRITRIAKELGADYIVMTKSSKDDMVSSIGTTAEYVINNAPCDVIIVSEMINSRDDYRGLIYRTATSVVNLRGLLGNKQSECLLPSVNVDCIYHFDVTVGKVKFFHTAYNPETRNWDLPPQAGQEFARDLVAGDSVDILVKADSTDGKADRIRLVNRDMKKEAVFTFRITAAPKNS